MIRRARLLIWLSTLGVLGVAAPVLAQDTPAEEGDETEQDASEDVELVAKKVDLPYALSLARTRSPQVKSVQYETLYAASRVDEAIWGWAPRFDLSFGIAPMPVLEEGDVDGDAIEAIGSSDYGVFTKFSIDMVVPFFTSWRRETYQELAEVGLDAAWIEEDKARMEVSFDVIRAYYGIQLANQLEIVLDEGAGILEDAQQTYDELMAEGNDSVDKTDKYRLQIAFDKSEQYQIEVAKGGQLAEEALRLHTKLEGPIDIPKMRFKPDDVTLAELDVIVDLAYENRAEMRLLDAALEAQELAVQLEIVKAFPNFFVAVGYSVNFSNAVPDAPKTVYVEDAQDGDVVELGRYLDDPYNTSGFGFLVGLEWQIDPINRYLKVEQAKTKLDSLEAKRELAYAGMELEIESLYLDTLQAQQNVDLQRSIKRSTKRIMVKEFARYELGGGDVEELLSAVASYFESRAAFLVTLHDFRVALAKLQVVLGVEDVDRLLAEGTIEDYNVDEEGAEDASEDDTE